MPTLVDVQLPIDDSGDESKCNNLSGKLTSPASDTLLSKFYQMVGSRSDLKDQNSVKEYNAFLSKENSINRNIRDIPDSRDSPVNPDMDNTEKTEKTYNTTSNTDNKSLSECANDHIENGSKFQIFV